MPTPAVEREEEKGREKSEISEKRSGNRPLPPESADWRDLFEERAAIHEHEGGYSREMAERRAFGKCVEEWCRQHPPAHNPLLCAGCNKPLGAAILDLPDGSRVHWESHRDYACLITAGNVRKRRAVAALSALGISPPAGWAAPQ